eukprot:6205101-Pleurochrysis_carterae.AAC.1
MHLERNASEAVFTLQILHMRVVQVSPFLSWNKTTSKRLNRRIQVRAPLAQAIRGGEGSLTRGIISSSWHARPISSGATHWSCAGSHFWEAYELEQEEPYQDPLRRAHHGGLPP